MNKTRRQLLVSAMLIGGAGTSIWYWSEKRQELVFSKEFHTDIIKTVGTAYLAKYPSERSVEDLQREVFGNMIFSSRENVVQHLVASIESDFINGNTAFLDGWLLSRTEMRFAAIATLTDRISL